MNLLQLIIDGWIAPELLASTYVVNSPAIRDPLWVREVNTWVRDRAPESFWNIQAQWDFGLGSVFGDNNMVADFWNPFLHFADADQGLTIAYDPPQSKTKVMHSHVGQRTLWGTEMHMWDFYKPPTGTFFHGKVNKAGLPGRPFGEEEWLSSWKFPKKPGWEEPRDPEKSYPEDKPETEKMGTGLPGGIGTGTAMAILGALGSFGNWGGNPWELAGVAAMIAGNLGIALTGMMLKKIINWGDDNDIPMGYDFSHVKPSRKPTTYRKTGPGGTFGGGKSGGGHGGTTEDPTLGAHGWGDAGDAAGLLGALFGVAGGPGGDPFGGGTDTLIDPRHDPRARKRARERRKRKDDEKKPKPKKRKSKRSRGTFSMGSTDTGSYKEEKRSLRVMYDTLDKNRDGKLSMAELKPLAKRFRIT